jgi:GT2 family glycosyltransferase
MPKVSIIVLNFNGKHFLNDCINSVLKQDFTDYELMIVDNNSSDGSVDFVNQNFPNIVLIQSDRNLGFAGGNNLGVKSAKGELVVLLNNDTIVKEGWLTGLVDAVEKENVAIASPLILTEHVPMKYWERKGSVNFLGHNIMLVFNKEEEIFSSSGACLIFRKNILGLPFDEDYFAYSEDVYLGLRARFLGYKIHHTNNSSIFHLEGGTFKKESNQFRTFLQERNRLLNMFLFFTMKTNIKLIPIYFFNIISKVGATLLLGWHVKFRKFSLRGLVQAYTWLIKNIMLIKKKRDQLKQQKKIDENEVIRFMTYKLDNGENIAGKILNLFAKIYFRLVNIKTYEFYEHD